MKNRLVERYDSSILPDELTKVYIILKDGSHIESTVTNISSHGMRVDISLPPSNMMAVPQKKETIKVALLSGQIVFSGLCIYSDIGPDGRAGIGIYFYYPNEQTKLQKMLEEILSRFDSRSDSGSKDKNPSDVKEYTPQEWEQFVQKICDSDDAKLLPETEYEGCALQFDNTLANVASQSVFLNASHMTKKVEETFESDEHLIGVIIIDDNEQLLGMISRKRFMELYSKPFRKELHHNKPVKLIVKDNFDTPLCLDETDNVDYAVRIALSRSKELMYEPIVVRTNQGALKLIDTQVLLLELTRVYEIQSMELQETLSRVNQLNVQLEESRERILESLNCASVIQESILPRNELFDRLFSEWSTLYHPRDIVGGDLYWLREINGLVLLAVIDCTGHGVPGAFMTMTVNSVMNHIVDTTCYDDPALILAEMNRVLQETLHLRRGGDSMVDAGLDIILCCINPDQHQVTYAGAGLSLYILADNELCEIKGGRPGVGYSGNDPDYRYKNHILDIGAGAILYAPTDGLLDENGGTKGFGFGRERFKEMVKQHAHHSLKRQREYFEQTLAEWRGSRNQRDDITMVSFRL
ncbi:MAG: SpoIIE family protein phosphatase [Desulfuromonadales bacterium]|nr:SpoIIE family protein phosphatase [Desulfuromonadales bacterium]